MCMRYQSAQKEFDIIHGGFVYGERLNVHVRMSSNEFDIIHGRFGYGIRNGESFGFLHYIMSWWLLAFGLRTKISVWWTFQSGAMLPGEEIEVIALAVKSYQGVFSWIL